MLFSNFHVHSDSCLADIQLSCQAEFHNCRKSIFQQSECMKCSPEEFERMFVSKVASLIDASPGLDHSKFARYVWGDRPASVSKWRRIKNASKEGKPQNLTISDAFRMVEFFHTDFANFSWDITREIDHAKKTDKPGCVSKRTALSA